MKNKGFTLVELIGVIVIVGLLALISLGIFMNVERNILEGQYKNVIKNIINKAEEYAKDTKVTAPMDITVETLIKEGYIIPDDESNIYDPRDKNNKLNCYYIHIILNNDEYEATFGSKHELEDGTCENTSVNTNEVTIYCNGEECKNGWTNKDITLSIHGLSEEDLKNSKIEWSSLAGVYELQDVGTEKKHLVSVSTILDTTYSALITTKDKTYNVSKSIKIDKENPVLISQKIDVYYDKEQKLEINASDMSGSGLKGYAITHNSCANASYQLDNIPITASGSFKLCLMDNAGNTVSSNLYINHVIFNYNNLSNPSVTKKPVYFLENNSNYPLLVPSRPGYTFDSWVKSNDERVYEFSNLKDKDEIFAKWNITDLDINVDKIDKDTVGVLIENKINMVLVLDVSGSMSGSELSNLKSVANNLIDNMSFKAGSTISIISFESSADVLLRVGTSANEAKSIINSLSASGGTSFNNALSKADILIENYLLNQDNNYMIFVSDGYDGDSLNTSYVNNIKRNVNTVYSIGIGSGADTSSLTKIASSGCYFNSNNGLDSLKEIFTKIQEEIREEVTEKSQNGLIILPNLYVTNDYPFILNVNGKEYTYPSISSMSGILTNQNNIYYLDLKKVDIQYKLNGNLKNVKFTYYYS